MENTKHTPGPWIHGRDTAGGLTFTASPAMPLWYAGPSLILNGDGGQDKALANARLIAAAPDLLSALVACVSALEMLGEEGADLEAGRAALAMLQP